VSLSSVNPSIDEIKLDVPAGFRKGVLRGDQKKSIASGLETLRYIAEMLEVRDFKDWDILDYGCGVKFTQAFLQYDLPMKSYYGIDIDKRMISFLKRNVNHPKITHSIVEFHNDLYSEIYKDSGGEMTEDFVLPCDPQKYDLIVLQSVLTHFNPHDFEIGLKMLKRYLKPSGKIFFTCILNAGQKEDFKNLNPDRPLLRASYNEQFALGLIKNSGLKIDVYRKRLVHEYFPEHFICSLPD